MGQAIHDPDAVSSFYHLQEAPKNGTACRGLACFAARARRPDYWSAACAEARSVYCLGQCHCAPAMAGGDRRPTVRLAAKAPVLLENILAGGVRDLAIYRTRGGGRALDLARSMAPDELVQLITDSFLRGRGGAAFSAGRKWGAIRRESRDAVLVVNADEGDPGAFSDKAILEDDPFRLFEGLAIAAHAVGAKEALIYLRCEYPRARQVLEQALVQAADANWPANVSIQLINGHGSFVCGEETALLNALESRRPFARARPPFPFQSGYGGRPTLVQNVETLASVPWIVQNGAEAYRSLGFGESGGTKLISLNSLFRDPGLVEVSFGVRLREIVDEIGGGVAEGQLLGVMIGGPLAGLLPPTALDVRFTYEDLAKIGGAIGHGGVIAFDSDTQIPTLIAEVFRFGASESCGLCVPCHWGTTELNEAFTQIGHGRISLTRTRWKSLISALQQTSLCGHGRGLAEFARSIERYYAKELDECLA